MTEAASNADNFKGHKNVYVIVTCDIIDNHAEAGHAAEDLLRLADKSVEKPTLFIANMTSEGNESSYCQVNLSSRVNGDDTPNSKSKKDQVNFVNSFPADEDGFLRL